MRIIIQLQKPRRLSKSVSTWCFFAICFGFLVVTIAFHGSLLKQQDLLLAQEALTTLPGQNSSYRPLVENSISGQTIASSSGQKDDVQLHIGADFDNVTGTGLILTSYFSFRQDPRQIGKYEWKKPTFETIYMFYRTVTHHKLRALIFHDGLAFDDSFIQKYTLEPYVRFIQVDPPTFDNGEPIITPNDFRYVAFDNYIKNNLSNLRQAYKWFLVADMDIFFNRDPFERLEYYQKTYGEIFFGSWDGGDWSSEITRLQRKLFRKCYGYSLIRTFGEDLEWKTPNGNCGLWVGAIFMCVGLHGGAILESTGDGKRIQNVV